MAFYRFLLIVSLVYASSFFAEPLSFNKDYWTGHELRGSLGFIADKVYMSKPNGTKVIIRGNSALFYGYEYGWQFKDHWFWSLGLEWSIAYPRNFSSQSSTQKKLLAWIQPLTHARIGYVFNNHALLTLGITYLWALNVDFRIPLTEHLYWETQYIQWFDGIFNIWRLAPTLAAAFDFANFGTGIGYKF